MWAAVVGFPTSLARDPALHAGPEVGIGPALPPANAEVVGKVVRHLEYRMPALDRDLRQELALTIVDEAARARIDPQTVLALIEVESGFDPAAQSGAGAVGLMQLMTPTFHRELARHGIQDADPRDPVRNVQAGVRYYRRLLDAFGREDVAMMAYNAGPNRILGYLREGQIPDQFTVYPTSVAAARRRMQRTLVRPELAAPALAAVRTVAAGN
ncbi:MAG: lytic transglycosylase domain-containing protein [Anaeromyxobacter sp.]